MRRASLCGGGVLVATLLFCVAARADFFSSSPGPLTQAHANIDTKDHCQDCHVGSRDLSNDKCLACHKAIGERIQQRKGVHASQKANNKPCELCHTDHKGRNKDILGFQAFGGREKFDHNTLTGYPLEGKHQTTKCEGCHTQKTQTGFRTYLKASDQCAACHQNPHGDMREPMRHCEKCHDAKSWAMLPAATFDHDRDTRYPLEKKHEAVKCVACHAAKRNGEPPNAKSPTAQPMANGYQKLTFRWNQWSFDCMPCHDNVHGDSLFGKKACKLCHSAKVEWERTFFDHNRKTRFPLDGVHAKTKCESCHKKDEKKAPQRACEPCHPDVHKERFAKVSSGNDCGVCHTAANWKIDLKFDHGGRTKFPLTGQHANADCRACHRGKSMTDWENVSNLMLPGKKVACMGCHQHEHVHTDPKTGQPQYRNDQCLDCHKMAGVIDTKPIAIKEVHGPNSRFPLTEGHAKDKVPCQKCHPNDLHKGTLGKDCLNCHTGGKWEARLFDHDTKTKWPLVGNHKDVLCEGCHPRRDFANNRGKGVRCINCHRKDDVHGGALGDECEDCHNPDGKLLFDHNDPKKSDWPLLGKHAPVRCADCHTNIRFKPTPRECGPCHPEPDIHRGQLGTLCAVCHVETDWKIIKTGHDVPVPRFGWAHDGIACVKCHPQGKLLAGTANLCVTCHRNDDIHHNTLGPNCGECHTQKTWAGAHFNHSRVGCDLVGVHRLLPCVDCHVGGNATALAPECGACHRGDAIRGAPEYAKTLPMIPMAADQHKGFQNCATCHNPVTFQGASASPYGRESVCR